MRGLTVYSYEADTVWNGQELAFSQGWPADLGLVDSNLRSFTFADVQQLAANAFSLPVWATVCCSYWLNPCAEWWEERSYVQGPEENPEAPD